MIEKGLENKPAGDERFLIAEWGAGTGRLSSQLSVVLGEGQSRSIRQLLIEDHEGHIAAIMETYREFGIVHKPDIRTSDEAWGSSDIWSTDEVLVVANELLDAFPVHRVIRQNGELWELGVAGTATDGFRYVRLPLRDDGLTKAMEIGELSVAEGQAAEVGLAANDWIRRLGHAMVAGQVLLIDYGDEGTELSAPHRMAGTLMTYRGHLASDSPFDQPGDRDLTAHVNFTAIRRTAESSGFRTAYYATQKQFLVEHGLLALLAEHDGGDPFSPAARRNRAIRQLLLSDGMSESFKVLLLEK
jgi:SAM-dependent MidA family methyltransferase